MLEERGVVHKGADSLCDHPLVKQPVHRAAEEARLLVMQEGGEDGSVEQNGLPERKRGIGTGLD